jgi:hypothetical protein
MGHGWRLPICSGLAIGAILPELSGGHDLPDFMVLGTNIWDIDSDGFSDGE